MGYTALIAVRRSWPLRLDHQNDLATVDVIGRDETAGLLIDAFKDAAEIYFAAWDKTFDARWEDFRTCLERIRQLIIAACRALWLGRLLPNPDPSYATPAEEEMALWFDRLPLLDAESLLDNEAAVRIYRARERELKRRAATAVEMASSEPAATPAATQTERAARRQAWMNERHPGWSCIEWSKHTRNDYRTIKKYQRGVTTNRTTSIRSDIARAEKVGFSTVPE